jgi:multidrug efflux pump subunit AcrB
MIGASELQIEISRHVLQYHGLSVSEVVRLVGEQSIDLPVGTIYSQRFYLPPPQDTFAE